MKHLYRVFRVLGFAFQYCIPIILFGDVIPLTHEAQKAGLTKVGFFALGILVLIIGSKLKERILQMQDEAKKQIFLSIFPIVFWVLIMVGMRAVSTTLASLLNYWWRVIAFIVVGRLFYIVSGILKEQSKAENAKEKTEDERNGQTPA